MDRRAVHITFNYYNCSFSPLWTTSCFFRSWADQHALLHWVHLYGFSLDEDEVELGILVVGLESSREKSPILYLTPLSPSTQKHGPVLNPDANSGLCGPWLRYRAWHSTVKPLWETYGGVLFDHQRAYTVLMDKSEEIISEVILWTQFCMSGSFFTGLSKKYDQFVADLTVVMYENWETWSGFLFSTLA